MTKVARKRPDNAEEAKRKRISRRLNKLDAGLAKVPASEANQGSPSPPSLLETVIELRPYTRREQLVRLLMPRYGVKEITIDRAIRKAKALAEERLQANRDARILDGQEFFERVATKALKAEKFQAAVQGRLALHRLSGDLKPDVILNINMDAPAEEQLKQAEELQQKAREALKRSGQ